MPSDSVHASASPSISRADRPPGRIAWQVGSVIALALIMGAPALRGEFVGGDDHRLVVNHVLVSRPSLEHAVKLFTIAHRDLYQPLPLLSFQAEFAVADAFGLFGQPRLANHGAWLFHLTNMLLHALNSVLVLLLMRRLDPRWPLALIVALLFAVHPVQAEVVAWVNGRMMLMSTCFALLSLLSLDHWLQHRSASASWAVLVVLMVLGCALSKVRVGLPVLLVLVGWIRARPLRLRFWTVWLAATAVMAVLTLVNVKMTADAKLFAGGAHELAGPRLVRVLLALERYAQNLCWPTSLSSYYPTPRVVAWADAGTLRAAAIVLPILAGLAYGCWRSRTVRYGCLWFAATIASTLPLVPARNVLAADRYLYLPVIGLFWIIALGAVTLQQSLLARAFTPGLRRPVGGVALVFVLLALLPPAWITVDFYGTPLKKTLRTATVFPDAPRVWSRVGWVYHGDARKALQRGDRKTAARLFDRAMRAAEKELRFDQPIVRAEAYQLTGMTRIREGMIEEGLADLRRAVDLAPRSATARFYLATALDDLGRTAEAVAEYEALLDIAPAHNPAAIRLARHRREAGRLADARRLYEGALEQNRYEAAALLGLAELDIQQATPESLQSAMRRLESLLSWMPDHYDARTNLGVARAMSGQYAAAIKTYEKVLSAAPWHVNARLNLAFLLQQTGDRERAHEEFLRLSRMPLSLREAMSVHDALGDDGETGALVSMWKKTADQSTSSTARDMLIWSMMLDGQVDQARLLLDETSDNERSPTLLAARLFDAWQTGRHQAVIDLTARLAASQTPAGGEARFRLLRRLDQVSHSGTKDAWTHYVMGAMLTADAARSGRADLQQAAQEQLAMFQAACKDAACRRAAETLQNILQETP